MTQKQPLPKRPRLQGFDYAAAGYYFVTFVTHYRATTLSSVVDYKVVLSNLGQVLEEQLLNTTQRFRHVSVDSYVIMPNHAHVLFRFEDAQESVKLSRVVNELKSRTTVLYNKIANGRGTVWQYGYYDLIIRSDRQLLAVRQYIENNPIKWELDELNPEQRRKRLHYD
jgi:putative transposase